MILRQGAAETVADARVTYGPIAHFPSQASGWVERRVSPVPAHLRPAVNSRFLDGREGVRMRVVRAASVVLLGAVLVVGLTACSPIRNRLMTPDPPAKDQQRASALYFRDTYQPNVEKVRFTMDGNRPGLGAAWSANAITTVAGSDYYVIIGPDSGVAWVGGTGMPPEAPTPSPHLPLTVIYSDGTSEVIE